jgi:RNA-directed DNA polymerase
MLPILKDVLAHAYKCCRANGGAAGVDGQSFVDIDERGVEAGHDGLVRHRQTKGSESIGYI